MDGFEAKNSREYRDLSLDDQSIDDKKKVVKRRNTSGRRQRILETLQSTGRLKVDQLALQFDVSEVSIRKDLTILEDQGWLVRRHGGCVPGHRLKHVGDHPLGQWDDVGTSQSHDLPSAMNIDSLSLAVENQNLSNERFDSKEKEAIATAAALMVSDQQRLMIDYGSTTTALVGELSGRKDLVIMTNSLRTARAALAMMPTPTLLMSGGTWDAHSQSFQGQIAEQTLSRYDFDWCFIGCDGIDLQHGTTTFNELLNVSRIMAGGAKVVVVVAESKKLGRRIPNIELEWRQIDVLITDSGLPMSAVKQIQQSGTRVIRAGRTARLEIEAIANELQRSRAD